MNDKEKAVKAGKEIIDGMRFDNLDEQRHVVNALKRYRKGKVKGKDLTLEQRLILVEIRARAIEPTMEKVNEFRKEFIRVYVLLGFIIINIIITLVFK